MVRAEAWVEASGGDRPGARGRIVIAAVREEVGHNGRKDSVTRFCARSFVRRAR